MDIAQVNCFCVDANVELPAEFVQLVARSIELAEPFSQLAAPFEACTK